MLPYPSYLRVYEPVGSLPTPPVPLTPVESGDVGTVAVTSEQEVVLASVVRDPLRVLESDDTRGAFVLTRDGGTFVCPLDLPLRSWLSMNSLADNVGDVAATIMISRQMRERADQVFREWRRAHPTEVPHIRQATWGVPRAWFLLVVEDEREAYDVNGHTSIRYRARLQDARRRLGRAQTALSTLIEDMELHEELADLRSWLDCFDGRGWLELDYAGVARLLGSGLGSDRSARDVHVALRALQRGDLPGAGEAYRRFEERWRVVNAYERAN